MSILCASVSGMWERRFPAWGRGIIVGPEKGIRTQVSGEGSVKSGRFWGPEILGGIVIKCHLSRLMGERKLKISDVARDTGINRGTITRLYQETATRVDLDVVDLLLSGR